MKACIRIAFAAFVMSTNLSSYASEETKKGGNTTQVDEQQKAEDRLASACNVTNLAVTADPQDIFVSFMRVQGSIMPLAKYQNAAPVEGSKYVTMLLDFGNEVMLKTTKEDDRVLLSPLYTIQANDVTLITRNGNRIAPYAKHSCIVNASYEKKDIWIYLGINEGSISLLSPMPLLFVVPEDQIDGIQLLVFKRQIQIKAAE